MAAKTFKSLFHPCRPESLDFRRDLISEPESFYEKSSFHGETLRWMNVQTQREGIRLGDPVRIP